MLKRGGHTEAAVDLARMAGLYPAGVLCEVVTEDKTSMARLPELEVFAATHGLLLISIADLIRYRRQSEKLVKRVAEAQIPTEWGDFTCYVYESLLDGDQHVALVRGAVQGEQNVLVRVHSECLTGDVFGSMRCDCGLQLQGALERVAEAGIGVVLYLRGHEGRGIGLAHKLRAYALQDEGADTVDANLLQGLPVDSREYGIGAQILVDLGITTMRLLTNNPAKYGGLEGFGLDIVERVPLQSVPTAQNLRYLRTKQQRLGHLLEGLEDADAMTTYEGSRRGEGLRIGVVVSRFNDLVTGLLLEGTLERLAELGVDEGSITVAHVPGAFELPLVAQRLAVVRRPRRGHLPGRRHPGRDRPPHPRRGPGRRRLPAGAARHRRARRPRRPHHRHPGAGPGPGRRRPPCTATRATTPRSRRWRWPTSCANCPKLRGR